MFHLVKRRLELEMEVKRNEKIQSEHKIPTESRHHRNINTRVSVILYIVLYYNTLLFLTS